MQGIPHSDVRVTVLLLVLESRHSRNAAPNSHTPTNAISAGIGFRDVAPLGDGDQDAPAKAIPVPAGWRVTSVDVVHGGECSELPRSAGARVAATYSRHLAPVGVSGPTCQPPATEKGAHVAACRHSKAMGAQRCSGSRLSIYRPLIETRRQTHLQYGEATTHACSTAAVRRTAGLRPWRALAGAGGGRCARLGSPQPGSRPWGVAGSGFRRVVRAATG